MKKKSFVFLVIVVGLLLAGCGKAATDSTQQSDEDSSLIGKWEVDYEAYAGSAENIILNLDIIDNSNLILTTKAETDFDVISYKGTYKINGTLFIVTADDNSTDSFRYEKKGDRLFLDGVALKKVDNFTHNIDITDKGASGTADSSAPTIKESESAPVQNEYIFTAGNYIVGEDISSGKYDVELVSGRGNCFAGDMVETFGDNEHAIKNFKNLTLKIDDTIEVKGTLEIKFIKK